MNAVAVLLLVLAAEEIHPKAKAAYDRAYEAFETRTPAGLRESLELFRRAQAHDPHFAKAFAGEADAACLLALYGYEAPSDVMPEARTASTRALEIDPHLAEAHASLGLTRYLYDWEWEAAESSFRKAIALDPEYTEVRHWYAMMLMATGRYDDALEQMDRAVALAPGSPLYAVKRGTILIAAGRYDDARAQLDEAVLRYPQFSMGHRELGRLEIARGRPQQALPHLERASALSGGKSATTDSTLAQVLGLVGERKRARAILHRLEERSSTSFVSPISLATVHVGLGAREAALDAMDEAYEVHDAALVYAGTQPALRALRGEPRFIALLERIGLSSPKQ